MLWEVTKNNDATQRNFSEMDMKWVLNFFESPFTNDISVGLEKILHAK